ncbi:MAG: hypothetical protein H0A75_00080 [Candidatus Methanofishera endochildressiae]|uniref:Secretion activating protein n=1 Tax=Candidatus Methanofishera endochildressiae TaxID=2738884 RepID=A0A7Z0SCX8_9GAMM|nr:hypothetical protein [Candidatus Methanofishera endochildressiae]
MNKQQIINRTIIKEGGYCNNPNDSGGETNYGITVKVARRLGYRGMMKDLTLDFAYRVYADNYWGSVNLDDVFSESPLIASHLFDISVNMGASRAGKFLQRGLNLLTKSDLKVDSHVGDETVKSLRSYMQRRNDSETLCKLLNTFKSAHYIHLAETRDKDRAFIYGWIKNRVD